jgi:hypothetical protein
MKEATHRESLVMCELDQQRSSKKIDKGRLLPISKKVRDSPGMAFK